ncbi:hypothetical protein T484DRAFT_1967723 [Baffinella frigidus]|nr:hypothetical protein T484DRAFT_1967723 [Cryptophyta sp. CCMP2293]
MCLSRDPVPAWFLAQHACGESAKGVASCGERSVHRPAASKKEKDRGGKSASLQLSARHYAAVKAPVRDDAIAGGAPPLSTVSEEDQPASNLAPGASRRMSAHHTLRPPPIFKAPRGDLASDPFMRLFHQVAFESSTRDFDGRLPLALRRAATLKSIHEHNLPPNPSPLPAESCVKAGDESSARIAPGTHTCSAAVSHTPEMRAATRWSWLLSEEDPYTSPATDDAPSSDSPRGGMEQSAFVDFIMSPQNTMPPDEEVHVTWEGPAASKRKVAVTCREGPWGGRAKSAPLDELLPPRTAAPPTRTASDSPSEQTSTRRRSKAAVRIKRGCRNAPKPSQRSSVLASFFPRQDSLRRNSLDILLALADNPLPGLTSLP